MQYYDNGAGFSVTATSYDVESFSDSWPCCDIPDGPVTFGFENNGDLVDISIDYDGADLAALADDCKAYGLNHKKQRAKSVNR